MTTFSNTPVIVTNTPISTGSLTFAGSALVFHKTDGIPFTVTYTIDAVAKPLTQKQIWEKCEFVINDNKMLDI